MKICFVPFTSALTFISECISSIYIVFLIVIGVAESSHSECEKKNRNTEIDCCCNLRWTLSALIKTQYSISIFFFKTKFLSQIYYLKSKLFFLQNYPFILSKMKMFISVNRIMDVHYWVYGYYG